MNIGPKLSWVSASDKPDENHGTMFIDSQEVEISIDLKSFQDFMKISKLITEVKNVEYKRALTYFSQRLDEALAEVRLHTG